MSGRPIEAAGALVWRPARDRLEVLVIHRVRHDDWSLPKGKLDPGEHALAAAVREVREETGVAVRVGPLLARHAYEVAGPPGGTKQVTYWCAVPRDGCGASAQDYAPNDEVDAVRWVDLDDARGRLSYPRDVAVLDRFTSVARQRAHETAPLLVLRHAAALARRSWGADDGSRPLTGPGMEQAQRLVPLLAAYGVDTVLSSDATRCTDTVEPYAAATTVPVGRHHRWSEQAATRASVRAGVAELLESAAPTVLCTHRPVLPRVLEELSLPPIQLEPAEALVVHRADGAVVGTEPLRP